MVHLTRVSTVIRVVAAAAAVVVSIAVMSISVSLAGIKGGLWPAGRGRVGVCIAVH